MDTQGTLEKIEEAVKLDEVVKVAKIRQFNGFLRRGWVLPTATAVGGAIVSAGATYFLAKRRFISHINEVEEQIEEIKHQQLQLDFERAEKDKEFNEQIQQAAAVTRELKDLGMTVLTNLNDLKNGETPEVVVERVAPPEVVARHERPAVEVFPDPEPVQHNVFSDNGDDGWDYEEERQKRNPENPYVIHVDEFVADEMGYDEQLTYTYYAGDDVMTDHRNIPVYDHHGKFGNLPFGHGSKDGNIVYFRDEKNRTEYEILRDDGSYSDTQVEQEWETADLKHSHRPLRMRTRD